MTEYRDILNQQLFPGDYVIYSAVDGRSGVLRIGKIIELKDGKQAWSDKKIPKLLCASVARDWEGDFVQQKKVTLSFLHRVYKIDSNTLSEEIKQLLS